MEIYSNFLFCFVVVPKGFNPEKTLEFFTQNQFKILLIISVDHGFISCHSLESICINQINY